MPDPSTDEDLQLARIVLRPLANPLPVGFLALGVATFGFSALQLGWVPAEEGRVMAMAVLLLTVPLQLLAAVIGYLSRDPIAATGMAILAGTWATVGAVTLTSPPGTPSDALGIILIGSAVAMLVPVAAAMDKLVAAGVMVLTALRFTVTGVYELSGSSAWKGTAGVVGLVLAAAALYAAAGFELESAKRRTVLPLLRRGSAADAMRGSVTDQIAGVQHEAGVRSQL